MSDILQEILLAADRARPPEVVLSDQVSKHTAYLIPSHVTGLTPHSPSVIVLHPTHRWAAERAGLTIAGTPARQPAPWTFVPTEVARARRIARIRTLIPRTARKLMNDNNTDRKTEAATARAAATENPPTRSTTPPATTDSKTTREEPRSQQEA